jgi:hypothetical protein
MAHFRKRLSDDVIAEILRDCLSETVSGARRMVAGRTNLRRMFYFSLAVLISIRKSGSDLGLLHLNFQLSPGPSLPSISLKSWPVKIVASRQAASSRQFLVDLVATQQAIVKVEKIPRRP